MKFSIVTAVYNRANTISDTIQSIAGQTYKNIEHVIQDGGSNDGTLDIIKNLCKSNIILKSEKDDGIYDAINRGILRSSGDVIGLLHSDDFYASPLIIEKISMAMEDPLIDGIYGDLEYVSEKNESHIIRSWKSGECTSFNISLGWMPPHPTLYLRRSVFERYGLYDTSLQISADYDAMLRWIVTHRIRLVYIPEVLVRMRTGGESNRSLERILRKSREDYSVIRRHNVGGLNTLFAKNIRKFSQFIT